MARTTSIWVVRNLRGNVIAAFTVMHELDTWLDSLAPGVQVEILKVRDGNPDAGVVLLNPDTLKPAI